MRIVRAEEKDLPHIIEVLQKGRKLQVESGNLHQWSATYPPKSLIQADIEKGYSYLSLADEGEILAVFCLMTEEEPTYRHIEGAWLNDTEPYVTIHRIASNQVQKGAGQDVISWILNKYPNVRIDTHADNLAMRHILTKLGFIECGTIYLENGDPRIAYQYLSC